jgi:hypothetical protein
MSPRLAATWRASERKASDLRHEPFPRDAARHQHGTKRPRRKPGEGNRLRQPLGAPLLTRVRHGTAATKAPAHMAAPGGTQNQQRRGSLPADRNLGASTQLSHYTNPSPGAGRRQGLYSYARKRSVSVGAETRPIPSAFSPPHIARGWNAGGVDGLSHRSEEVR